jgi:hypothetical protein
VTRQLAEEWRDFYREVVKQLLVILVDSIELGSGLRFCDSRSFAAQEVRMISDAQLTGVCVVAHLPSGRIVPST